MSSFEEMKKRYPRSMQIVQVLWILIFATILSYVIVAPIYIFNIEEHVVIDFFTFPPDIIPQPYNLIGIFLLPLGGILTAWANYALLYTGKIGLSAREPMQRPSTLVLSGPFRFTRNPIYLGCLLMLLGLVIVWSSVVTALLTFLVYLIFRYVFIKREEIILEEEFGEEYLEFKNRVRRWL